MHISGASFYLPTPGKGQTLVLCGPVTVNASEMWGHLENSSWGLWGGPSLSKPPSFSSSGPWLSFWGHCDALGYPVHRPIPHQLGPGHGADKSVGASVHFEFSPLNGAGAVRFPALGYMAPQVLNLTERPGWGDRHAKGSWQWRQPMGAPGAPGRVWGGRGGAEVEPHRIKREGTRKTFPVQDAA